MVEKLTYAQVARNPPPPPPPPPPPRPPPPPMPNPLIPSSDTSLQLMNMPTDVFSSILRAIFLKQDGNVKIVCNWRPDSLIYSHPSLKVGPRGLVSMLCTNKAVRDEGLRILYEENTFECYHVRVLKNEFIHDPFRGIGVENASRIRKVHFGLPLVIIRAKQEDSDHIPFLDLLCQDLPGLHKLTIKTHLEQVIPTTGADGDGNQGAQIVRIQALLATAARTTKYHPNLRKAIYRQASGGQLQGGIIRSDFYVDLTAEGFGTTDEGCVVKTSAHGTDFISTDVVLNTKLIRQTMWRQYYKWATVKAFELLPIHDEATDLDRPIMSSEVDKEEVTAWPGASEYDPLLELEHADQVALVRVNHGKWIGYDFNQGGFVNERFVPGEWLNTGFVQAKHMGTRYIEGKPVEPQWVQGQWVTDTEFIEGKFFVDGGFIRGVWTKGHFIQGRWSGGVFTQGKWEGELFTGGKWVGRAFYAGTWQNGHFLQGVWGRQPALLGLSAVPGAVKPAGERGE